MSEEKFNILKFNSLWTHNIFNSIDKELINVKDNDKIISNTYLSSNVFIYVELTDVIFL